MSVSIGDVELMMKNEMAKMMEIEMAKMRKIIEKQVKKEYGIACDSDSEDESEKTSVYETASSNGFESTLPEVDLDYEQKREYTVRKLTHRLQVHVDHDNSVILTSSTQCGKTDYVLSAVELLLPRAIINVIVCESFNVQLNQLKERLTVKNMTYEVLADACSSKRTIETFVVKWNKRLGKDQNLTILMLNNTTQITKLSKLVDKLKFTKINVFVDEGDTLNKYDCAHYNDKGKTQDLWEEFFDAHEARVFKVFITATPENVIAIQKVTRENILLLPVPSTYRKVTELHPWEGNIESVQGELDRIRALKNGEFILYVDEVYKSSHEYYARDFSVLLGCVTVGYNGDGVIAYINGESCGNYGSISSCLSAIKPLALMKGLIVIGAKLINRGISFVGSDMDEPMAASVMFLVPSKKPYCVATAQILGRVTGTGRSDITRRAVYCTQKVIKAYTDYLHNQELIFNGPSGFSGLKNPDAKDPGIPLDRPRKVF